MKIRLLMMFYVCFMTLTLMGQEEVKPKLYPIEQTEGGWNKKYTYKRQIIESPLALQIPLLEARDPEVSYEFLTYKRQKRSVEIISAFTTGFSVYTFLSKGHYRGFSKFVHYYDLHQTHQRLYVLKLLPLHNA